jgi:hypothetical protein
MLDPFDEIKRLYFSTTRETIERDIARALDLLKRMPTDEDRDRAAGYMHGLSDLRREWNSGPKGRKSTPPRPATPKTATSKKPSGG